MDLEEFKLALMFAAHILKNMNKLNVTLQGKGAFAHDLYQHDKAFWLKLALLSRQIAVNNFNHFTWLKTETVPSDCAEKYRQQVNVFREEWERRFLDFH